MADTNFEVQLWAVMHVHIFEHIFKALVRVNCDGATCSWPAISHLTLRLAAARLSELDHHSCSMATSTVYISLGMWPPLYP